MFESLLPQHARLRANHRTLQFAEIATPWQVQTKIRPRNFDGSDLECSATRFVFGHIRLILKPNCLFFVVLT